MLKTRRILRDHADAGSLNSLLAPWAFLGDAFLTKAGDLGFVYKLSGVDYECLDRAQRRDVAHRFESALRLLDERYRVYEYLVKRRIDPVSSARCRHGVVDEAVQARAAYINGRQRDLFNLELFAVLTFEGLSATARTSTTLAGMWRDPRAALGNWLSSRQTLSVLESDLDAALAQLAHTAASFETLLADTVRPTRLPQAEAFRFLKRLVNYAPHKVAGAALPGDAHVDYFMADSPVECHRSHLDVDGFHTKVLTMKEPPSSTFPALLEGVYTVPGEFIACLEWRRLSADRVRRDIHMRRRHFFNRRVSLVNYVSTDTRPEEMLVDESATATVQQLGNALTEMEVNGHFFGECSLAMVLFDQDSSVVDRASAEAIKALAGHDGTFVEESYNLLNAWLAVVPGNSAHNLRRLALLETNCADLSFLFTLHGGNRTNPHLGREALAVFETQHQTPYHFNLHVDDVGHALVLGATGAGKSFLLNFLVTHAQKYEPRTVIFDLGHSYRRLASLLGGSYLELGLHQEVTINPFALESSPENLHFQHAFVRLLLEDRDGHRLSEAEDRELYDAIENLYVLDREQRRLFTVANMLPRILAARLSKWVGDGRYAGVFDHVDDTLSVETFQVFDFEAMRAYPELLEAFLFYVLHRVDSEVHCAEETTRLKVCVMDEAWRFIQHDRLRAYVQNALKTWRKYNGAMVLATQAIDDFASADLLRTVVESCPTKLLLANPALDRVQYAELFQLNETELDLLAELLPRRQMLLKRPDVAKVLNLEVDPRSYWIYTNTPGDNERAAAAIQEHGFSAGLDRLAASA